MKYRPFVYQHHNRRVVGQRQDSEFAIAGEPGLHDHLLVGNVLYEVAQDKVRRRTDGLSRADTTKTRPVRGAGRWQVADPLQPVELSGRRRK